jgi:hypothetical protein
MTASAGKVLDFGDGGFQSGAQYAAASSIDPAIESPLALGFVAACSKARR